LTKVADTTGIRGLVLRSNRRNFCTDGDLEWMKRAATYSREENNTDALNLSRALKQLSCIPVPSIAVVQGAAFGRGGGWDWCLVVMLPWEWRTQSLCFLQLN
jgi:methylglutaconyl-CoA hydratase